MNTHEPGVIQSYSGLRPGWYESVNYPIDGAMYSPYVFYGDGLYEAQSEGHIEVDPDEYDEVFPLRPLRGFPRGE